MESGCDCWALLQSQGCHCDKILLEKTSPSGVIIWASGIARHVQRIPALDVKVSLGVKEFSEVPGQEISVFFLWLILLVLRTYLLPEVKFLCLIAVLWILPPVVLPGWEIKWGQRKSRQSPTLGLCLCKGWCGNTDKILYACGHDSGALLCLLWCLQRKAILSASLLFLFALPGWSIYLG